METTTNERKAMRFEVGHYYSLKYGNGTQVFYVTKVTKGGRAFGLRLYGRGTDTPWWDHSSLKAGDPRVRADLGSTRPTHPTGIIALPAMPAQAATRSELAALKAAADEAASAWVAADRACPRPVRWATYNTPVYAPEAGTAEEIARAIEAASALRDAMLKASSAYRTARAWARTI